MLFGAKYDYNESALTPKFDCTNQSQKRNEYQPSVNFKHQGQAVHITDHIV